MSLRHNSLSAFNANLLLALICLMIFSGLFTAYVFAEKEIDHTNQARHESYLLANELRQSSDDLTRMVRTYVANGNIIYKKHFESIIAIRDGKLPRPHNYQNVYWDVKRSDIDRKSLQTGKATPLLELIRKANFTKAEIEKLEEAKSKSDLLVNTELAAIKYYEASKHAGDANQMKAIQLVTDETYGQAKASIMKPINDVYQMMETRTSNAIKNAEQFALNIRYAVIAVGILFLFVLWRTYHSMRTTLGAPLDILQAEITRIGSGDFTKPIPVKGKMENSIMGWLSETQIRLSKAHADNARTNRLYATLSYCNEAIVRCKDTNELFNTICRDAVLQGGISMCWIGIIDETDGLVKPVASYGQGIEYLDGIEISTDVSVPSGQGPTGTAVRENHAVWCQDFANNPMTAPWHKRGEKYGWNASASLPLIQKGNVVGALTLYSSEIHAFDVKEQKLLSEMTLDINFAISRFADELQKTRMQDQLIKLSLAVEQSPSSIIITDLDANIQFANTTFLEKSGYDRDEIINQNARILQSGKTPKRIYTEMWSTLLRGDVWKGELINRSKTGTEYVEYAMISPIRDAEGNITNYLAIKDDITEKKQAGERIRFLAHFDQLTGLPNRVMLQNIFRYALNSVQRSGGNLAVLFIDLDHFKYVNDTLGQSIGDQLLIEFSKRIKSVLRDEDTASRASGDEFIVILPGINENSAANIAGRLLNAISAPYQIHQHELITTASIGIAIYPNDGNSMESLYKNADTAMHQAKQTGRNNFRFFTQKMQENTERHLQLANALRFAIERNQLQLHYQPQVSVDNGHISGVEALLRWQHPDFGAIPPSEFIPIAENTGQITKIGEWVLRGAIKQMKAWLENHLPVPIIAVNLSAQQFRDAKFPELVASILEEEGLPHNYLELELTEAVAMDDPEAAVQIMDRLDSFGIRMSIDDFGTGYSSLSYLKRFKIYKLKIDQSFVHDITDDAEDKAIVTAIINMATSLGMRTIAEGVETAGQLAFLRLQGCDEVQGYYFSKALTASQLTDYARLQTA